uniref:Oxidored_molyb domain-containing protein n=1 Tax=Caenorhabditis tropicalis TaxID=1561998 RepID=A0A1I7UQQ4_9PELO
MGWISGPSIQFKGVDGTISTITIKESTELEYTEKVTIGGHTVPFVITTKTSPVRTLQSCELVWYDERIGLKIVADYICELFSSVPSELSIAPSFLWMLEMFNDISQMVLISPIPSKGPYFGWVPLNEKENLEVLKAKIRCPFLWLGGDYPDNFSYTGSFEVHD